MADLQTWMTASGETDETLSEKVGVSRVQVSRIRRGINRPSPQLAARLEGVTGITAWDFLKPADVGSERAA